MDSLLGLLLLLLSNGAIESNEMRSETKFALHHHDISIENVIPDCPGLLSGTIIEN